MKFSGDKTVSIVTNFAIILGLILVIYELNQTHTQSRAQLNMDDYSNLIGHRNSLMGENPAEAIAKAMSDPESLSDAEKIIVDAHFRSLYQQLSSQSYMAQIGLYEESWRDVAPVVVKEFFNYPYAVQWWTNFKEVERIWDAELVQIIDGTLEID